jgi:hypothetical protein
MFYARLVAKSSLQKGADIDRSVGPFRDQEHFKFWLLENGFEEGKPGVYGVRGHSKIRINLGDNASKELSGMIVWIIFEEPLNPADVLIVPES